MTDAISQWMQFTPHSEPQERLKELRRQRRLPLAIGVCQECQGGILRDTVYLIKQRGQLWPRVADAMKDLTYCSLSCSRTAWNRQNTGEAGRRRMQIEAAVRLVKSQPCSDCRGRYPVHVMDLDHLPEYQKESPMAISQAVRLSLQAFLDELQKCEAVCANCHRVRTAERSAA